MNLIDTHHHVFPPNFTAHSWSIETDQADMNQLGVNGAALSCVLPLASEQVREINQMMAEARERSSAHYAFLASIPFDNADNALREIEYASEELKADGFCVPTHNHGIYISDDSLDVVFEELNRRHAVIFLHPCAKRAPGNDLHLSGSQDSAYEYVFDTTRAIMDFIYKDKMLKTPQIQWVLAHAGGVIPYLSYRLTRAKDWRAISQSPDVILKQIQSLYYDLALADNPAVFRMLKDLCGVEHIMFGSDYPPHKVPLIAEAIEGLIQTDVFTAAEKESVMYQNAAALIPRFRWMSSEQ